MPEVNIHEEILSSQNPKDAADNLTLQLNTRKVDGSMHFILFSDRDNKRQVTLMDSSTIASKPIDLVINQKPFSQLKSTYTSENPSNIDSPNLNKSIMTFCSPISVPTNATESNVLSIGFPTKLSSIVSAKQMSDIECMPISGTSLQRIGHLQHGTAPSSTPLVAFVNPTATSLMPQSFKPVLSTSNSALNTEIVNQVVYSSAHSMKNNTSIQQFIFVKPSALLSKLETSQYFIASGEKSNVAFPKPTSQMFFGNDSAKFIPVATIVPNNASFVTNSKRNVTSYLQGETILATQSLKKSKGDKISKISTCNKIKSPDSVLYSSPNDNIFTSLPSLSSSSKTNQKFLSNSKEVTHLVTPQPLNLTLQVIPQSSTNVNLKGTMISNSVKKTKYLPVPHFYPHNMAFHSTKKHFVLQNMRPRMFFSPLFQRGAWNGISNRTISHTRNQSFNSKFATSSPHGSFVNLSPSQIVNGSQESKAHLDEDPPMTLKIESIYSLADRLENKNDLTLVPSTSSQRNKKLCKEKITDEILGKSKKNVRMKRSPVLRRPRGRPPQKHSKLVNKTPSPKSKQIQLDNSKSMLASTSPITRKDITVSCLANDFESLKPITEEERKLNRFFKYLGLRRSSSPKSTKSTKCCDLSVGDGCKISSHCYVSRELARCFSCYLVVPKLQLPDSFIFMNTNNALTTVKVTEKCSKKCRHKFLKKVNATTGIITRSGKVDSYWKIIPELTKCSHTRKKYCRKSKMKAIANAASSECKCLGCINCPSKKTPNHGKLNYFKKKVKTETSSSRLPILKGVRDKITTKYSTKKETSTKKSSVKSDTYSYTKSSHVSDIHQIVQNSVFTNKNISTELKKRKLKKEQVNGNFDHKIVRDFKEDIELQNEMLYGNSPFHESVEETVPFAQMMLFRDDDELCKIEEPLLGLKTEVKYSPSVNKSCDSSASSDRIKLLKEILKEKQKDLEIARQLLM